MSSWQLGLDLVATFLLAAGLLFHYGNWYRHHVVVTLSVLIAWYFSFIIVFVLPIDISTTSYRQCLRRNNLTEDDLSSADNPPDGGVVNGTSCYQPHSYVGGNVLTNLWRVVYWTSQCLTWLILPMMQSYTQAGEFTVKGKIRSALLDNAIYYGMYLFICSILLIYLATRPEADLHWPQLKAIASSASNSWGLFLLVFMLGYGLVSVPQMLWASSSHGHSLNSAYFKIAKLSHERNSAEENLDDVLESLQSCMKTLECVQSAVLHRFLSEIEYEIPVEFRERMKRRRVVVGEVVQVDEKMLVKLHKQVKKTLQNYHRVERQWEEHIYKTITLEDVLKNSRSLDRRFKPTFHSQNRNAFLHPLIEWYWRCVLHRWLLRTLSVVAALLSLSVIWSEATFFNKSPVLSIYAAFLNLATDDFVTIEIVSTLTIAYMAICAFYTIFKVRVFNFYYLAGSHHTDEYSLIFSGMLLCRLTPPLCLNVISVFQLDSHIVRREEETSYTTVMGHMDVLSLISDGFNIYFPMGILLISLLTWFKVGSRILSVVGFHQFLNEEDEITTDLVGEGTMLLQREKRRRQRSMDNNRGGSTARAVESANQTVENLRRLDDSASTMRYGTPADTVHPPPRDLFDDV